MNTRYLAKNCESAPIYNSYSTFVSWKRRSQAEARPKTLTTGKKRRHSISSSVFAEQNAENPWKFILIKMMMYPSNDAVVSLPIDLAWSFLLDIYKIVLRGSSLAVYESTDWLDPVHLFNYVAHIIPESGEVQFCMILHPDIKRILLSKGESALKGMEWPHIVDMIRRTRQYIHHYVPVPLLHKFEVYYDHTGGLSCKNSMDSVFSWMNNGIACILAMNNTNRGSLSFGIHAARRAVHFFHAVHSHCTKVKSYLMFTDDGAQDRVRNPGLMRKIDMLRVDSVYYISAALYAQGLMADASFFMAVAFSMFQDVYCSDVTVEASMRRMYTDAICVFKECKDYDCRIPEIIAHAAARNIEISK